MLSKAAVFIIYQKAASRETPQMRTLALVRSDDCQKRNSGHWHHGQVHVTDARACSIRKLPKLIKSIVVFTLCGFSALLAGCDSKVKDQTTGGFHSADTVRPECHFSETSHSLLQNIGFADFADEMAASGEINWPGSDDFQSIPESDWFYAFPKCREGDLANLELPDRLATYTGEHATKSRHGNKLTFKLPHMPTDLVIVEIDDYYIGTFYRQAK